MLEMTECYYFATFVMVHIKNRLEEPGVISVLSL